MAFIMIKKLTNCIYQLKIIFLFLQADDSFLEDVFKSAVGWLNIGGLSVLVPLFNGLQRTFNLLSPDRYNYR